MYKSLGTNQNNRNTVRRNTKGYQPIIGATVPYFPEEVKEETVKGKKYFNHDGTYYQPISSEGGTIYMVVADPNK